MAKLRLIGWLAAVGAVGWWCGSGLSWPSDPVGQAMTVVRALTAVLAAYLLVATVLAIRLPPIAPAFVRRLVAGAVGSALLATPMTATASAEERVPAAEAPVLRRVDEPAPAVPATPAPPTPARGAGGAAGEAVVGPGDHLWSIAERVVAGRLGRAPTDDEVAPYWAAVVERNAHRLSSGDPDLVFPGETVVLPS